MNGIDHISAAIWNFFLAAFNSVAGGVFMGVMARHAIEAQAGKHALIGPLLYNKLWIGGFLYFVATGAAAYLGKEGAIANALAALIGIAGPELVLGIVLARLRAKGLIGELRDTKET